MKILHKLDCNMKCCKVSFHKVSKSNHSERISKSYDKVCFNSVLANFSLNRVVVVVVFEKKSSSRNYRSNFLLASSIYVKLSPFIAFCTGLKLVKGHNFIMGFDRVTGLFIYH